MMLPVVFEEKQQTAEDYLEHVRQHEMQNSRDDQGMPTLCSAIDKFRSPYLVEELLKDGADGHAFSCRLMSCEKARTRYVRWGNFSALHLAVALGYHETVRVLLTYGADVKTETTRGIQPLDFLLNTSHQRCLEKRARVPDEADFQILRLLYAAGVDPNTKPKCSSNVTMLHRAMERNNLTITRWLIEHDCDVSAVDVDGKTPLHYCKIDAVECAKILLENGANPNAQDNSGNTIYHRILTRFRQSENANCTLDFLRLLHDFNADPNVPNDAGKTGLHVFLNMIEPGEGVEEVVDTMLRCGANPNIMDKLDRTPVYYLVSISWTSIWEAWKIIWPVLINFLRYGAILKKADVIGTPLLHALMDNCLACPEYFDSKSFMEVLHPMYEVEVNCRDVYNRTVLHLVSAKGNWEIAEVLLNCGANMEAMDCDGNTPLHVAVLCKQWEFARILLLWPLRATNLLVNASRIRLCFLPHGQLKFSRKTSDPAMMVYDDQPNPGVLENMKNNPLERAKEKLWKRSNERPAKIRRTISLQDSFAESQETSLTFERLVIKWTPENLDFIAKSADRDRVVFLNLVEREIPFRENPTLPAPTMQGDFLNRINKSSLLQLCEESSVGKFHLMEECGEEHCLIARQVYRLVTDLVQKCSEIDPRLKNNILWTGSSAEGTKMWLPDEFDFLMELVKLHDNFDYDHALQSSSDLVIVGKECQKVWSNLCLHRDSYQLSFKKLKTYISTLLWKASFSLDRKKYKNIHYSLCEYDGNLPALIRETKVGVNMKLCWRGRKYQKLIISIDLTPAIPIHLTKEQLSKVHKHSVGRVRDNHIHVVPYVSRNGAQGMWRPSFSILEVEIMRCLSPKQVALYKGLKFFRDIYKSFSAEIPSYHLKTFIFNWFLRDCGACHMFYNEYEDFGCCMCRILYHLNRIVSPNYHQTMEHFFLNYKLDLADYDMRWMQPALNLLENN